MATARKNTKAETPSEPARKKERELNPRTARSHQRFQEAKALLADYLSDGEWHPSNEIHNAFKDKIGEGMYGRVKSDLVIEHRRVKDETAGRALYEWRLPSKG